MTDWVTWHRAYDDPASSLSRRLVHVQRRVAKALGNQQPGPIRVLSMCAGQGRDLLEPLAASPRRHDVTALLVEADERLAASAAAAARDADLEAVHVAVADAGETGVYAPVVPAHLALVCGVFGNVSDADVERTVGELPALLTAGATVIWTRSRRPPDLTLRIRGWFARNGFDEIGFDSEDGHDFAVGTHVLREAAGAYRPGVRLFGFT